MLRMVSLFLLISSVGCVHINSEMGSNVRVLKRTETSVLIAYDEPNFTNEDLVDIEIEEIANDSCMEGYDLGKIQTRNRMGTRQKWVTNQPTSRQDCQTVYAGSDPFTHVPRYRTDCRTVWSNPTSTIQNEAYTAREYIRWIVCHEEEVE
jgi:hypothetical protein